MKDTVPNVEVTVVSRDLVKPSSQTPSKKQHLTLSYVDQIVPLPPFFPTCGIVFYTATPQTQPLNIHNLKASLSKTLSQFYPIAGRVTQSYINCNDEGVPFIETHVNCSVSTVLKSTRKLELMTKFLPPHDALGIVDGEPVKELIHLAIQVSAFDCGGVAIGWYDIHKVMDGMSSATFFKNWAALARGRCDEVVEPDFDAVVTAFPPATYQPPEMAVEGLKNLVLGPPPTVKRFVFKNVAINELKALAASEKMPKPTRLMTVAGFIWEQALQVSQSEYMLIQDDGPSDTILQVTLDMRSRLNPPLRKSSMGNLATIAIAKAEKHALLPEFVAEIDAAVTRLNDDIKGYVGEKGVKGVRDNWNKLMEISSVYKEKAYKLVTWCRLGFNDLDFGFGKPKLVVPTDGNISPLQRNVIILMDYSDSDGDGIEAWLFMEDKEMKLLESKQEFLAFASPLHCTV